MSARCRATAVGARPASTGEVLAHRLLDAWGNEWSTGVTDPRGYRAQHGYYTDQETGLIALAYRYYAPGVGRFVNRDPIGFAGGVNVYGYVGAQPVGLTDPIGFAVDAEKACEIVGESAGAFAGGALAYQIGKSLCLRVLAGAAGAGLGGLLGGCVGSALPSLLTGLLRACRRCMPALGNSPTLPPRPLWPVFDPQLPGFPWLPGHSGPLPISTTADLYLVLISVPGQAPVYVVRPEQWPSR